MAEISKATFYLHYHDIYDLSDTLQQEVIQNVLNSLSEPERILTDEISFNRDLFHSFMAHQASIDILFSGSQASVLPSSIEKELRAYIFRQFPKAKEDAELNILLTYKIQGGYYAFQNNQHKYHIDFILNAISNYSASQILPM